MDRKFRKKIIACIVSFCIVAGVLSIAGAVLKPHSKDGVMQSMGIYDQPEGTIDVLMLGSSHIYYGVNTAKLWEDYGITGYDLASAEQSLWVSYHYLIEACKTQKPKVVVLDFFTPAAFMEDHKFKYSFLSEALYGMRFSLNKLQMMFACFDGNPDLWNRYFPSFFGYHDEYVSFESEDIGKLFTDHAAFKGYTPHFGQDPTNEFYLDTENVLPPSEKSQKYLKKIVDYTKKHGIKLYITIVPYRVNEEQTFEKIQEEDKRYNWLVGYVEELGQQGYDHVSFDYTVSHMESFDLEMESGEDMDDSTHLNYYGSCKFTDYLAKDLRLRYGEEVLSDHRGDSGYESWDENAKIVKEDVLSHGFEWR